jgi:hypothetical protein
LLPHDVLPTVAFDAFQFGTSSSLNDDKAERSLAVILSKIVKKYFIIFIFIFSASCRNETEINEILNIGKELTTKDLSKINSTENIVFIGNNLKKKIIELKKENSNFKLKVQNVDMNYPYGDSKAENVLILNNGIQKINVRLKYNSNKKKFDILGFASE